MNNLWDPQRDRRRRGQANVRARRDFMPCIDRPDANARAPRKDSHTLKIARYRDRLLMALLPHIDSELFNTLEQRSLQAMESIPENSERALYSDLIGYVRFCIDQALRPLPVQEYTLDCYVSYLMGAGRARKTIERHVSSLVKWHRWLGLDDPRKSFTLETRMAKVRQQARKNTRQAEGLRVQHLKAALEALNPAMLRDVADIALLFCAFDSLCRRSELSAANWGDFSEDPDGSGLLFIPSSKTDQDHEGAYQYLSPVTCELLRYWQQACGRKEGALFRGIYSDGTLSTRLSDKGISRCFKRIAKKLGFAPELFSGHSTRVGGSQEMIEQGISDAQIMLTGRWSSSRMLVVYGRKIKAKKSGAAELAKIIGTDQKALALTVLGVLRPFPRYLP